MLSFCKPYHRQTDSGFHLNLRRHKNQQLIGYRTFIIRYGTCGFVHERLETDSLAVIDVHYFTFTTACKSRCDCSKQNKTSFHKIEY